MLGKAEVLVKVGYDEGTTLDTEILRAIVGCIDDIEFVGLELGVPDV